MPQELRKYHIAWLPSAPEEIPIFLTLRGLKLRPLVRGIWVYCFSVQGRKPDAPCLFLSLTAGAGVL
ncbi:hypothetical protein BU251_06420 [Candidatus Velamenicoccus archaeovorus]|uniref:Uncharacterized protein n=1 Tax=Velamenicoccus archaeovorus TaxID=1930593 RepID=A0A410P5H4_VELA1|nr:hypothetical protein BU251_06420 [Candidatus Velamenicoccus archaeovorus]